MASPSASSAGVSRPSSLHRVLLVTGMSGGGKSTATKALEDAGWFCIDNLPIVLLPKLLELATHGASDEVERLALVVDAREGRFLESVPAALDAARADGHQVEVLFLDCADEALQRRFSETRRRHPLSPDGGVAEGIARERELLAPIRSLADDVIDSTRLTVHELRDQIARARRRARQGSPGGQPRLLWFSPRPACGQRRGPRRALPAQPLLHRGAQAAPRHRRARVALGAGEAGGAGVPRPRRAAPALPAPQYRNEGKSYLTVSIGCTGGRHRSVALVEELARRLGGSEGARMRVAHRDITKI